MAKGKYIKDKKVTILENKGGRDENGFPIDDMQPIEGGQNIWAYYRHASANEFYGAAAVNVEVEVIFKINWRDDLKYDMKIEYKGEQYGITRIDDFEGYKKDLTIYAYKLN